MYNRKEFKKEAKQLIRQSKPHYMLVTLVFFLLTTALSTAVSELGGLGGLGAGILSVFLTIMVTLFIYVMNMGYANYALRLSRGEETGMKSLFESFSYSGRSIALPILVAIYTFAWSMLLVFGAVVVLAVVGFVFGGIGMFEGGVTPLFIVVSAVVYIVAVVLIIMIGLRYSMARFALAEHPEERAGAAIRRSIKMMKGNKGKFFIMQLSFIGWEILLGLIVLVVMTVGFFVSDTSWVFESLMAVMDQPDQIMQVTEALGFQLHWWIILADVVCLPLSLWIIPYSQTAYARFYNHVSGYDAYVAGCDAVQTEKPAPVAVSAPVVERPAPESAPEQPEPKVIQPPAGGYYTPPAQPKEESEESEQVEEL